jgi:hypothetical protein
MLPPAVAASQAYTDGIVLALAAAAALAATRRHHGLAGVLAALAALARPPGLAVAVLVAHLAWREGREGRAGRVAVALAPSAAALAAFLGWMQVARGDLALPLRAQHAWDRGQPVVGLVTALPSEVAAGARHLAALDFSARWTAAIRDLAFLALYVALLRALWRREGGLRSPWVAYSALVLAIPLSSGTITSIARFGIVAFPLAWPLADALGGEGRRWAWAAGAAVVLTALMVAQLDIRSP